MNWLVTYLFNIFFQDTIEQIIFEKLCVFFSSAFLQVILQREFRPIVLRELVSGAESSGQGAFNNYVDRILPFFAPPPCVDNFYTLSVDKSRHFLTPSPLILSTQLLNGPLPGTCSLNSHYFVYHCYILRPQNQGRLQILYW